MEVLLPFMALGSWLPFVAFLESFLAFMRFLALEAAEDAAASSSR